MFNKLALALLISLPLVSSAATEGGKAGKPAAHASAPAAAASAQRAQPADPHNSRKTEIQNQRARGAKMAECQKLAADQGLAGLERKQFLGNCVSKKP